MDYHIVKISRNKKQYLDLLLLGDEQEIMVDRYLERGDLFVLEDNGIKAVCVVTKEGPKICELKNIAVTPSAQRQISHVGNVQRFTVDFQCRSMIDKPLLKRIYSDDGGNGRRSWHSCIL